MPEISPRRAVSSRALPWTDGARTSSNFVTGYATTAASVPTQGTATLKIAHVIGATVIFGTCTGIAFFMLMAHLSNDAAFIGKTARVVVIADMLFTATAVVLQPATGWMLMHQTGLGMSENSIPVSLLLYAVAGLFWLPVVWMQTRMRDLALAAASSGTPLPASYYHLFRLWFLFGFPGLGAVLGIIVLMVVKPVLW
jgi:uncharacterized membrane protein